MCWWVDENGSLTSPGNKCYWKKKKTHGKTHCAVRLQVTQSIVQKKIFCKSQRITLGKNKRVFVWFDEQLLCLFMPVEPLNPATTSGSVDMITWQPLHNSATAAALHTEPAGQRLGKTIMSFLAQTDGTSDTTLVSLYPWNHGWLA